MRCDGLQVRGIAARWENVMGDRCALMAWRNDKSTCAACESRNSQIAAGVAQAVDRRSVARRCLASGCPAATGLLCAGAGLRQKPVCRVVRERYWDGYGWVYRRSGHVDRGSPVAGSNVTLLFSIVRASR
jgi:hypothetical protein